MSSASEVWSRFAPPPPVLTARFDSSVFVAYGSADHVWLVNLCDALRNAGHRLVVAQRTMTDADRTADLDRSLAGLLVWSSAPGDAEWMRRTFDAMTERSTREPFSLVIARFGASALPDFAAPAPVVDFPLNPNGPGGGEALRLLLALAKQRPSPDAETFATQQDALAVSFIAETAAARNNPDRLQALLAEGGPWETASKMGCAVADRLPPGSASPMPHCWRSRKLLPRFPDALRPRQMKAFAHARRGKAGDSRAAQSILKSL